MQLNGDPVLAAIEMIQEHLGGLDAVRGALNRAIESSSAWNDDQRAAFDRDRLEPLRQAGLTLAAALDRVDRQLDSAAKELRRD